MFYGSSGTGKTLAVEAVSHELGALLIHLVRIDAYFMYEYVYIYMYIYLCIQIYEYVTTDILQLFSSSHHIYLHTYVYLSIYTDT
jgi:Cdc6-like AAA superfamily ATPase